MNIDNDKKKKNLQRDRPFCGEDEIQNPRLEVLYRNVYSRFVSCSTQIKRK